MKIQNLAVIFIIIILPISMILTSYVQNQVKTLSLQTSYDSKLNNATYDALKAFQINTINSDSSDLANSKLRDIEASANSFFTSLATNFNMEGYNQDILKEYVPALVYTMYDGYYIYSPFKNTLDESDAEILKTKEDATYKDGETIWGLKPYIYYSCRYVRGEDDFVITYSLDNYITIQGQIKGEQVFEYGYLMNMDDGSGLSEDMTFFRGVTIGKEILKENLDNENEYNYTKINGVKYYKDIDSWFSVFNGERYNQNNEFKEENNSGVKYYSDAAKFKEFIKNYGLEDLKSSEAVFEDGTKQKVDAQGNVTTIEDIFGDYLIFNFNDNGVTIEEPSSNFNQHRLAVIRYSIEKNLSIAIANYNNYSGVETNFLMPELKEDEWEKILNNVSIISFLQGLNIGGKIYNGYSIIANNKNKEVVNEESIYIKIENTYHRVNEKGLEDKININYTNATLESNATGILNIDFERKSIADENGVTKYFFPQKALASYDSVVNQTNVNEMDNIYDYLNNYPKLAKIYYTALGRERYSMYKTNNDSEKLKQEYLKP